MPDHLAMGRARSHRIRNSRLTSNRLALRIASILSVVILILPMVACFDVNGALQNAINQLANQSASWQATLQNLENQLIAHGQSTLANQVQSVLNRAIAGASLELRCNVDFLASELAQALQDIKANFNHQPPPGQPPHFCNVDPSAVDLRLPPDSRPATLNIYGFNFTAPAITVAIVDTSGNRITPPAGIFTVGTEFEATLNIVNFPFSSTASYVSFMLPANEERRVSIIQPPNCGGVGQACCQQNPGAPPTCDPGLGCSANKCTACPPAGEFHKQVFYKQREFAGNNCGGVNETRTYGGQCDGGFLRDEPAGSHMTVDDSCDVCTATPSWTNPANPSDCRLNIRFFTPSDCFKGIHVDINITESPVVPQGCPSF
jgi:hypothetical protein